MVLTLFCRHGPLFLFPQLQENLLYLTALEVLADSAQQKEVGRAEFLQPGRQPVLAVGFHLADEDPLAHAWGEDPSQPVDEAQGGEGEEGDPPVPDDEEVVLVEHVVGEQAEDVVQVSVASGSSSPHRAGHYGGEEVAQRVQSLFFLLTPLQKWLNVSWRQNVADFFYFLSQSLEILHRTPHT